MRPPLVLTLVPLLLALAAGAQAAEPPAPRADAVDALGLNAFAFDLYRAFAATDRGNLFFSPFSISTALAMTATGAKGETLAAMERTLRVRTKGAAMHEAFGALVAGLNAKGAGGNFELAVANRLFGQTGKAFLPDFLKLVGACYGEGVIHPLDFAADPAGCARFINDWVAQATKDRIRDLLPADVVTAATRLVLVNAIYFKGSWAAAFDKAETRDEPFTGDDGTRTTVPLMHRQADYRCAELDGAKAVELPYRNDELSLIAILPPEGKALDAWAKELAWERLAPLLARLDPREVVLSLPRFKLEWRSLLAGKLKALGMELPCSAAADFSAMDGTNLLFISEVIHQAFVDVNEEGTEAAAATAVVMTEGCAVGHEPPQPFVFRADRPFLFLIRDNASGALLFLGRVAKP